MATLVWCDGRRSQTKTWRRPEYGSTGSPSRQTPRFGSNHRQDRWCGSRCWKATQSSRRNTWMACPIAIQSFCPRAATATIPIVFTTARDPVEMGLVASLSRPGGNVTGTTQLHEELLPKRLELAHQLVPMATILAVLVNPTYPNTEIELRDLEAAAPGH